MLVNTESVMGLLVDNYIYMLNAYSGIINRMNIHTLELEMVCVIPKKYDVHAFGGLTVYNNKIYVSPTNADEIWIYDMVRELWKSIELSHETKKYEYRFFGVFSHEGKVFFLGHYYPGIMIINCDTEKMKLIQITQPEVSNKKQDTFYFDYYISDYTLFLPLCNRNGIVKMDLNSLELTEIHIGDYNAGFSGIAMIDKQYWIAPRGNGPIIVSNLMFELEEKKLPKEFDNIEYSFRGVTFLDEWIVFMGQSGKSLVVSRKDRNEYKVIDSSIVFIFQIGDSFIYQSDKGICCYTNCKEKVLYKKYVHINQIANSYSISERANIYSTSIEEEKMFSIDDYLWELQNS